MILDVLLGTSNDLCQTAGSELRCYVEWYWSD